MAHSQQHPSLLPVFTNLLLSQELAFAALQRHARQSVPDAADPFSRFALMVLHTGCGKSGLIALVPFALPARPQRILVIAPDLLICSQLYRTLNGESPECFLRKHPVASSNSPSLLRVFPPSKFDPALAGFFDITVLNVQKLLPKKLAEMDEALFDLIIVDEAHHYPSASWRNVIEHFRHARVVFVTATAYRSRSRRRGEDEDRGAAVGPGAFCLPLPAPIFRFGLTKALEAGLIKDFRDGFVEAEPGLDAQGCVLLNHARNVVSEELRAMKPGGPNRGLATRASYTVSVLRQLCCAVRDELRQLSAVRDGVFRQAIVYCSRGEQAMDKIVELFAELGVPAIKINHDVKDAENKIAAFTNEKLHQVAVVHRMMSEGYDNQRIAVAAFFSRVASLKPFVQFVGRAARALRGPDDASLPRPSQKAVIISHKLFGMRPLFDAYIADQDYAPSVRAPGSPSSEDSESECEEEEEGGNSFEDAAMDI